MSNKKVNTCASIPQNKSQDIFEFLKNVEDASIGVWPTHVHVLSTTLHRKVESPLENLGRKFEVPGIWSSNSGGNVSRSILPESSTLHSPQKNHKIKKFGQFFLNLTPRVWSLDLGRNSNTNKDRRRPRLFRRINFKVWGRSFGRNLKIWLLSFKFSFFFNRNSLEKGEKLARQILPAGAPRRTHQVIQSSPNTHTHHLCFFAARFAGSSFLCSTILDIVRPSKPATREWGPKNTWWCSWMTLTPRVDRSGSTCTRRRNIGHTRPHPRAPRQDPKCVEQWYTEIEDQGCKSWSCSLARWS